MMSLAAVDLIAARLERKQTWLIPLQTKSPIYRGPGFAAAARCDRQVSGPGLAERAPQKPSGGASTTETVRHRSPPLKHQQQRQTKQLDLKAVAVEGAPEPAGSLCLRELHPLEAVEVSANCPAKER